MTVENISWSNYKKECCRPRRGSNPQPPEHQSDAHPTESPRPATSYLISCRTTPFEKGTSSKRKEFAPLPLGTNSFLLEYASFKKIWKKMSPLKMCPFHLKCQWCLNRRHSNTLVIMVQKKIRLDIQFCESIQSFQSSSHETSSLIFALR